MSSLCGRCPFRVASCNVAALCVAGGGRGGGRVHSTVLFRVVGIAGFAFSFAILVLVSFVGECCVWDVHIRLFSFADSVYEPHFC